MNRLIIILIGLKGIINIDYFFSSKLSFTRLLANSYCSLAVLNTVYLPY